MGKVSARTAMTGTGAATGDLLDFVDVSASTAGSKKITLAEFLNAFGTINAAGTALTGANTATGDELPIWDVSATAMKYITMAEVMQSFGVTLAAATALTGANSAVGDLFFIYDVSTTAIKSMTAPELLNVIASATINATAMTTGFHATQDFLHYSDNGVAKSITVPYLGDALATLVTTAMTGTGAHATQDGLFYSDNGIAKNILVTELANAIGTLNTTALTGANTATDDRFMIWDLSATAMKYIDRAELNNAVRLAAVASRVVAAGGTLSVTAALHGDKIIALDTATGSVCTLPAASGTGNVYTFITKALATSNSHIIKVADASGLFAGVIHTGDNADGTATAFATVADSDTITLNRTTTGSVRIGGDRIVITDIATDVYSVSGCCIGTGGEATPFSATV